GLRPLHIDDELHQGRYRILHLLGRGTFADVWLAENRHYSSTRASSSVRYVAIKIMTTAEKSTESQILRHLQPPAQPSYVVSLFDDFEIRGINGTHRCIVMEFLDPTPLDLEQSSVGGVLPLEISRRAVAQFAKGLAFLHSRGVMHGG
ncbi:kinase-like protein, partial [Wilcoxina mikolae CBS 423.85]